MYAKAGSLISPPEYQQVESETTGREFQQNRES